MRATDVSSHSFNEDAFAGIMQAVDEMDWSPYAGRVVLLVTDAGALRKNDPLGRTQMNEAEVRQAALRKGVKIYALHLRTPAGKNNHGYAEQQYRSLTADANPKIADLYIPVAGGEVNAFGNTVKEIGTVFADLVHDAGNRKPQAPRFDAAPSVASKSAAIGYAMQMEFLGRRDPVRAPQVVTAWTADRDLTNPALPAFQDSLRVHDPKVLIMRGEGGREFLAERLRQGDSTLFLARDAEARALGFVQLYPLFASLALRPSWLLSDLYVRPEARRRGVGEALMNQARGFAESMGACGLQLETAKTNHAGQSLYEGLGYVRDEQFYTYWLQL